MKTQSRKNRIAFPIQLFSERESMDFADSGNVREIHVVPCGKWQHWSGRDFEITPETVAELVQHFNNGVMKDLRITAGHDIGFSSGELPAVGWFKELIDRGANGLYASVEWTAEGMRLLKEHAFKYFSAELAFEYRDLETEKTYKAILTGGALTNRPFFKQLDMDPSFGFSDEAKAAETIMSFSVPEIINQFSDSMNKEAILAKPQAEWTPEEIAFMKTDEAGLTDAEKEAHKDVLADGDGEGGDGDGDGSGDGDGDGAGAGGEGGDQGGEGGEGGGVAATAVAKKTPVNGQVTLSAAEYAALEQKANEGATAFQEVEKMKLEKRFDGLVFSSSNKEGRFLPKQKDAVVGFMTTLSASQRDQFTEIVKNMPKSSVSLSEIGTGEGADVTLSAKKAIDAKVEELRKGDPKLSFSAALKQVLKANPDLEKQYNTELNAGEVEEVA